MRFATRVTHLPSLLLGATLWVALSACSRGDESADRSVDAARPNPAEPVSSTSVDHEDMAGMGQSPASMELHRIMEEGKAMPMTMSGNVDKDFARMMSMHHQTAIAMVDVLQQNGQAAELKAMAAKMKADQQEEIRKMEPYASADAPAMPGHEGMAGMQGEGSMELQRVMDESKAMPMTMSGNADKDFAAMMTMHHQTAIDMIDAFQQGGQSTELKALAAKMKAAQQEEIQKLAPFSD